MMQQRIFLAILLVTSCVSNPDIAPPSVPTNTKLVVVSPTPGISIPQPEWIAKKNSSIFILSHNGLALFIEPETAEILFLTLPDAHWIDSNLVGFSILDNDNCPSGKSYQYVLNLSEWKTDEVESVDDTRFCVVGWENERLNLWLQKGDPATVLKIYDNQSENWEDFLYPPTGLYNLEQILVNKKIFIVQGDDPFGLGNVIAVYDFETKQILRTFVGNVEGNILQHSEEGVVYVTDNTPCIIDVQVLKRRCGKAIPNEYQGVMIGPLLPDKRTLPFLYFKNDVENKSYYNLCLINILSGGLTCPTEKLVILRPESETMSDINDPGMTKNILLVKSIFSYSVSPDGRFVAFCYGSTAYSRYMGTVILDINEGDYHVLDDQEFFPELISYDCQRLNAENSTFKWRPPP